MSKESKAFLTKYPTPGDVEIAYSPMRWEYAARNPEKAYLADCPSLSAYEQIYGNGAAADWVYMQVLAVYGSSSCRDKELVDGIALFAACFAQEVKSYTLAELMLFFARYKAGMYDSSYAAFDTRRIGNAFFKEFLPMRNRELDVIMRKQPNENKAFIAPKGYSSLSWYRELKERAQRGDKEAIRALNWLDK